jgi:hypothetical protein
MHHRPMAIVEDEVYCEILKMFHSAVDIKSAMTSSRDIQDVFNIAQKVVIKMLEVGVPFSDFIVF